jgi:hypothetical protein
MIPGPGPSENSPAAIFGETAAGLSCRLTRSCYFRSIILPDSLKPEAVVNR